MISYIREMAKREKLIIEEADHQISIELLPADIRAGVRKNAKSCVIAAALKRQLRAVSVHVLPSKSYVQFKDRLVRFKNGASLRRAVEQFDLTGVVEPGLHKLLPHGPTQRLNAMRANWKDKRKGRHMPTGGGKRAVRPLGVRSLFEPIDVAQVR